MEKRPITYVSNFRHSLDSRSRVTVPASWRVDGDEGNYYLAWIHPEGCIAVFPPEMQEEMVEKVKNAAQSNLQAQALLRQLFGNAAMLGCDKQGRILLNENLCKQAGISKDVVMVGLGRNFQIWSAEKWSPPEFDYLEAMSQLGL